MTARDLKAAIVARIKAHQLQMTHADAERLADDILSLPGIAAHEGAGADRWVVPPVLKPR